MRTKLFFVIVLMVMMLFSFNALAYENVEWVQSSKSGHSRLVITINSCDTYFDIKISDLDNLTKNEVILEEAVQKAITREASGCR